MRLLLAIVLFAVAAFCSFGFLATFEPVSGALAWRVGYGVLIIACFYGVLQLLRGGREDD